MRIGELSKVTGVSVDTLRYYERIKLLPRVQRSANGYREYLPAMQSRIHVIRNAVALGFPLHEIARVLRVRDEGGSPCRQVRDYAVTIVEQIDRRISDLRAERKAMLGMINLWNKRLAGSRDGERVGLLEAPGRSLPRRGERRRRA
jgi:DNA-binding transcriptional MerR regulator